MKKSFWERKAEAMTEFGVADRPQSSLRPYLLYRRKLNLGLLDSNWSINQKRNEIVDSRFPEASAFKSCSEELANRTNTGVLLPPDDCIEQRNFKLVNDKDSFQFMLAHIRKEKEIAMDLESNDDHSYLGMTCTMQFATSEWDFVLDVFPLLHEIMTDLKPILEGEISVIYFYGMSQDAVWLKRCFNINVVNALDMQLLMQQLMKTGDLTRVVKGFLGRAQWFQKNIGDVNAAPEEREIFIKRKGQNLLSYEAFVTLFFPSVNMQKIAQLADFRPRNPDDVNYNRLLHYARCDVYYLFQISQFFKIKMMEESVDSLKYYNWAFDQTKRMILPIWQKKIYPSAQAVKSCHIPPSLKSEFELIYNWRDRHAKLIDESPQAMLTDLDILKILRDKPSSEDELEQRIASIYSKPNSLPPESLKQYKHSLFRLLREGQAFINIIDKFKCNNFYICKTLGHAAWGCHEEFGSSADISKNIAKENAEWKRHENHRKQVNKRKNKKLRKMNE